MKVKKILSLLVAMIMALGCVSISAMAEGGNVAKVGNTEYATIDEAIANWTNGTTLTLLSDVTLSDVIKLSSTEYHILDLGTYTMTAAKNKDAIQYVINGRSSAGYALDIKADAADPGGITATGGSVVRHTKPLIGAASKDRPITRFYGGVFNASYVVRQGGTFGAGYTGADAPYFQFYGGEYNGTIYTNRSQNQFHGGTFNGSMQMSVDSSAYTLVAGGTFKNLSNSMGSALNSDKFTIGSAKGANNGSVCIDENGNYVISTTTPTVAEASVASNYNSSNYFYYSTVNTNGMYYEDVYDALEGNKTGTITVFADEIDLSDTTFTGTIVVPEGEEITIVVAEGVTPAWTVESAVENVEPNVTYEDTNDNELVKNEDGSFVKPDTGETNADVIVEGVDIEIAPVDGVSNSYEITLAEGETWTDGAGVTMTFPAVEGAADGDFAYVVHEHEGVNYIYVGKVADGSVTITNTVGFSTFTVYDGDLADALAAASAMTGDVTVEIYDKVTLSKSLTGSYSSIKFVGKADTAEIYLDVQGYITATGKDVAFENLTLSKSAGEYITNAGFMNVAFGIYDVKSVSYTNCTFANGAYASSGTNTFTSCTFYKSYDKYGLWAYGNVDVVVDGCTFADYRGIKMYAEGAAKTVDLTVKNTNFTAVTDKPAIVLTYGENVTLEKNTYSSTGVFELDLDGTPNGTPVTSDVAPTCKNDNGVCGVLVDGKIYTTVAQAAEVATADSTVTLLHNSAETVEFAEGVILDKNGFEAAGVTVAQQGLTGSGTEEDPYKIGTKEELFFFAEKVNDGTYKNVYAELIADIDLEQDDWTSIGTSANPFTGTFDGKDYTISNVWSYERGLFGFTGYGNYVDGPKEGRATIKNLTINGVEVYNQSTSAVGGVIGQAGQNTELSNVTVTGYVSIYGYGYVGGIVGQGYVHIDDCHVIGVNSEADVISEISANYWAVGGIVGHAGSEGGSSITNCSVENVKIYSAIYGAGAIAGVGTKGPIENVSAHKVTIEAQSDPDANGYLVGCNYKEITGNSTVSNMTLTVAGEKCVGADVVAMVGEDCYFQFADAIAAVEDGDTVTLLSDVELDKSISFTEDIEFTIDGNGHTISPAVGSTETDSAFNFGQGSNATVESRNYTIKNVVFDGWTTDHVLRLQGVKATVADCQFVNCNQPNGLGLLTLTYCEATVTDCIFKDNTCVKAIDVNSNANADATNATEIKNCTFENNNCSGPAGVIEAYEGAFTIKDSEFIDNIAVSTSIFCATDADISGNYFAENTYTGTKGNEASVLAGPWVAGTYAIEINDNAFADTSVPGTFVEDWSETCAVTAAYNLNGNYWNGGEPDYGISGEPEITLENYYTIYEDGVLGNLVEISSFDGVNIDNIDDLKAFRDAVNAGDTYKGKTVYLKADIDLAGENWTPIGTKANAFQGTFDGQEHTISNLKIDNADLVYAGLFGYAENAKINNVKINNVDIHAYSQVGAIAGTVYTGSVSNCHVSGTIKLVADYAYAGGITSEGYVTVTDCSVIATGMGEITVGEKSMAGGITGWRGEGKNDIRNCTVKNLNITAWASVGAITGLVHYENTIDGCTVANVNLYKTRVNGQASIGLAAGNWSNEADDNYTITITNNSFDDITINGTAINSLKQLYGSNYSYYDKVIKLVESGNTYSNIITTGFKVVAGSEADLANAFAYADDGETITLVDDFELATTIKNTKNITLDLNGKNITTNANTAFTIESGAEITVKDSSAEAKGKITAGSGTSGNAINVKGKFILESGNIYSYNNAIYSDAADSEIVINGGTITAKPETKNSAVMYLATGGNVVVNGGTLTGYNGILMWNHKNLTINGGEITATGSAAIQGNGTWDTTDIVINDGEISGYYTAIYHPQGGKLTINGGSLTGWTGVVVKGGTIKITDGTISGTGAYNAYKPVSSGYIDTGDGLYVENFDNSPNSENYGPVSIEITGGTFTSENGSPVGSYANPDNEVTAPAGFISGGTFTVRPDDKLAAEGFEFVANTNGTFGVEEKAPEVEEQLSGLYVLRNTTAIAREGYETPYYRVRAYAAIDSLNYKEVGFEYRIAGSESYSTSTTSKVYTSRKVTNTTTGKVTVLTPDYIAPGFGNYIFAINVWANPENISADTNLEIRPYAKRKDGTTMYLSDWKLIQGLTKTN